MMFKSDLERSLFYSLSFQMGILPPEPPNFMHLAFPNMNIALDQLSKEDARKAKRKFRKVWRRLLKKVLMRRIDGRRIMNKSSVLWYEQHHKSPGGDPTAKQRNNRKSLVSSEILGQVNAILNESISDVKKR